MNILLDEKNYANVISFDELFVIHQNSSLNDIIFYSLIKNVDFFILNIESKTPNLSKFNKNLSSEYLQSFQRYLFKLLQKEISNQFLKVSSLSLFKTKDDIELNDDFLRNNQKVNKIIEKVEKSKLLKNDIVIWRDKKRNLQIKIISEKEIRTNSPIFLTSMKKFILRNRGQNSEHLIFDYLIKKSDFLNSQLGDYNIIEIEKLKKAILPLDVNILIDYMIAKKSLRKEMEMIYSKIEKTQINGIKHKVSIINKLNYINYVYFIDVENEKLIEIYDNCLDQLSEEIENLNLNSKSKTTLDSILTLDVVPFESKLYD